MRATLCVLMRSGYRSSVSLRRIYAERYRRKDTSIYPNRESFRAAVNLKKDRESSPIAILINKLIAKN